jgi:hypothetical protein
MGLRKDFYSLSPLEFQEISMDNCDVSGAVYPHSITNHAAGVMGHKPIIWKKQDFLGRTKGAYVQNYRSLLLLTYSMFDNSKSKGKPVPELKYHAVKMYPFLNYASYRDDVWGSGGIASCILNIDTRWRPMVSLTARRNGYWYPLDGPKAGLDAVAKRKKPFPVRARTRTPVDTSALTEHHAMKAYWRSGGIAPLIL